MAPDTVSALGRMYDAGQMTPSVILFPHVMGLQNYAQAVMLVPAPSKMSHSWGIQALSRSVGKLRPTRLHHCNICGL